MEHITYIGEVVEKLADHSSFPELFIKSLIPQHYSLTLFISA